MAITPKFKPGQLVEYATLTSTCWSGQVYTVRPPPWRPSVCARPVVWKVSEQ